MQHFHRQFRSVHSPPLSCQALEQAGDHAGARDAFERALALGTDPKLMADPAHACPPPAAAAPLGTDTARGPVRPASGFEHYESLGFLSQEETAGAVGGLARAALRLGDLALGLRAAAAAADAALSLECAGILERQGRLEVSFCTLEDWLGRLRFQMNGPQAMEGLCFLDLECTASHEENIFGTLSRWYDVGQGDLLESVLRLGTVC